MHRHSEISQDTEAAGVVVVLDAVDVLEVPIMEEEDMDTEMQMGTDMDMVMVMIMVVVGAEAVVCHRVLSRIIGVLSRLSSKQISASLEKDIVSTF